MTETTDMRGVRDAAYATGEVEQLREALTRAQESERNALADCEGARARLADTESKLRAAQDTIGRCWESLPDDYTDTHLRLNEAIADLVQRAQDAKVAGWKVGKKSVLRTLEDIHDLGGDADIPTIVATLRVAWEV